MSTRSRIGYVENEKYYTAYCHWDGYPKHNGKILVDSYTDFDKIKELVSNGDFSSLSTDLSGVGYFDDVEKEPTVFDSFDDLLDYMNEGDQEYLYLYKNGEWVYYTNHTSNGKFEYMGLVDDYFKKEEQDD